MTAPSLRLAADGVSLPAGPFTVRDVFELYDLYGERGRCARASADRKHVREQFAALHGSLQLADCRPFHLRLWVDSQERYRSDWTRGRAIRTISRPFNWAAKLGIIDRNPFWGVSQRQGRRGRPLEDHEWRAMLRGSDARFRRVLIFNRFTGARPGEMSAATRQSIELDAAKGEGWLVLLEHKTSETQRDPKPRIIPLHPVVCKLLVWMLRHAKSGQQHLFANARGGPWTRSALSGRIQRLRARVGLPKDAKLYGLRHRFATEFIVHGGDLATLAELLGHQSTRMAERYVHLARRKGHLLGAVKLATDSGK